MKFRSLSVPAPGVERHFAEQERPNLDPIQKIIVMKIYTKLNFFIIWSLIALIAAIKYPAFVAVCTLLVVLRIVQLCYERIMYHRYDLDQVEALFSLYHHLSPKIHLPSMRPNVAAPDFQNKIIQLISENKPDTILEFGSGVSSAIISEYLLGKGLDTKHYALEHSEKYLDVTRKMVRNPNSVILHAPLVDVEIAGKVWRYYRTDQVREIAFDMIIVDGPPGPIQKLARYPALPLVKMSDRCVVLMDDCIRSDEKEVAHRWAKEFDMQITDARLKNGAYVLTRKSLQ